MARCGCGGGACACYLAVGDGLSLAGSGSIANPYLINLDDIDCTQVRPCISAGDGLSYNSGTGVMTLRPSSDAGNVLEIGGDGGAYAGVSCAAVRPCLSGGNGITYSPVTGLIETRMSTDPGNNAVFGGDGGVYVPVGGATVVTDCGLTGVGSAGDPLTVAVGNWDYPCDISANAGRVFCDPGGTLRSEPRGRASFVQQINVTAFADLAVPVGTPVTVLTDNLNVPNPDTCRAAFVMIETEVDVDITMPPNNGVIYGIGGDDMVRVENKGTTTANDQHWQVTKVFNVTIPAGGAIVDPIEVRIGGNFGGGSTYSRIQVVHRAFVFNL